MAGLSHLRDVYDKRGKDFLEGLLNKTVIVNEKMDGAFFGAQKNPETNKFKYFKRNAEITHIDRVLSKYYEPAIKHFDGLDSNTVSQIPNNYHFGMEWFTSPKAQTIAYDRLPKNGLILSYIHILDESGQISETVQDKETLDKWAGILNIEPPPIVFQGKLTDFQKEKVQEFIYTPFSELVDRFKTTSFTKYIISVLNPEMGASFLRDTLDQDIEGLVFRFYDPKNKSEDSVFLAKLVDPVFQANAKQKAQDRVQKKSDDYIWIIVIDLMNFIERHSVSELRSIKLSGKSYEERYISLVNHIYLNFISEFGEKYTDLDIQIPEFLQREEFGVNFKMINNNKVTKILESNHNFKEIYRIFLNIFRKKSVRVSSTFFTKEMRANLVSQINKLSNVILGDSVFENYFPTFGEFVGEDKDPGYFESYAEIPEEKKKAKRVNVIISDFQPIHPGHIKSAQKLFDTNGLPCLFACIHSGSTNKAKPFKKETVSNILAKLVNQHPSFITGWVMVSDNEVENLLREIKPAYDPVIVAASKNRIKDIALQLELARKRSRNLNFKKDLKLIELPPAGLKDSIMKHIKNQDYLNFKVDAPNEIHSEFFNMNRDMNESVNEAVEASFANEVPQPDESTSDIVKRLNTIKNKYPEAYDNLIKLINRRLDLVEVNEEAIIKEIISRNYKLEDVKQFLNLIGNGSIPVSDINSFGNYINNNGGYDLSTVISSDGGAVLKASDFQISEELFKEIIKYKVSGPGTGQGELSAILFASGQNNKKNKANSKKAGDININNELIEVKAQTAKLQNTADTESGANYADGRRMMPEKLKDLNLLINKRKDLIDKVIEPSPDELTKPVDEKNQNKAEPVEIKLLSEFEPKHLNIGKVNLNGRWLVLKKLAAENGLNDNEFARWFVSLFYTIKFTKEVEVEQPGIWTNKLHYDDNLVNDLITETELYFKNETSTDEAAQSFLNKLGWHSLLYYQKCDKFKKLLYADIDNNSIIIYDPLSGIGEFLKKFKIENGPNWSDSGTNSCFKLNKSI
jgi:hypothetical protein